MPGMHRIRTGLVILGIGALVAAGVGLGVAAQNDSRAKAWETRSGNHLPPPQDDLEPNKEESDTMSPLESSETIPATAPEPASPAPRETATGPGRLARLPDSPNAVSSRTKRAARHVDPLPMLGDAAATRERILRVLAEMGGNTVIEDTGPYVHTVFVTRWLRFRDDVEFYVDEDAGIVHFRSASRTGYYDFGANRRRYDRFRDLYLEHWPGSAGST